MVRVYPLAQFGTLEFYLNFANKCIDLIELIQLDMYSLHVTSSEKAPKSVVKNNMKEEYDR